MYRMYRENMTYAHVRPHARTRAHMKRVAQVRYKRYIVLKALVYQGKRRTV